jgi:acyl carrier protein
VAQGASTRLVAFCAPEHGEVAELRRALSERLPSGAVPHELVLLTALPRTSRGKLDRSALHKLVPTGSRTTRAPRSPMERTIAEVWRELLGAEQLDLDRSFVELGGSSLLLVRAQHSLEQKLGRPVPLIELFDHPTVASLAAHLERATPAPTTSTRGPRRLQARREALTRKVTT